MDSIQLKKFAQVIANDEKLQIRLANANSMEEIRNMLKSIVGIQSDKDAEDFLRKAYYLGSSKQILTDDQLSKVSGGLSIKNFMLICIGGIASLCITGPLMSNLNVAHAYDSGGAPISYPGTSKVLNIGASNSKDEGAVARSDAAEARSDTAEARSDTFFQAAHERMTVTCYAWSVGAEAPHAMNRSDIKPEDIQAELNEIPQKQTSRAAQQVSEATEQEGAAAASAAAATGETEPKGIPEGLEQGSYWNDMFSTNYVVFLNSFVNRDKGIKEYRVGEETKSYGGDVNNEIEHLLINLAKSDGSTECRTKFSHNYRGNYLHCMQMHEANGTTPASQSDTYKCVMKWLEFAVAFGKVGSCVDIKQEDCKAIVGNKNDDEAKRKIDTCVKDGKKLFGEEPDIAAIRCVLSNPEMKVLIMSDTDIISYAKKYVVGQGTDAKFDETFEKSLRSVIGKYQIEKVESNANKAGVILLAEKLMMDELYDVTDAPAVSAKQEKLLNTLLSTLLDTIKKAAPYEGETTLKNRAVGMACHTIEDSFNPSHCDRHMTYTSDEKGKVTGVTYGGIKSFMDYAVQGYNHAKFDKISEEDFTKNLVGSPSNQSQIKTVGLKQVVDAVKTFLGKMYGGKDGSKYENAMGIMKWISENVIYFDEQIARVEGYRPYAASGDVKLNGTSEIYRGFVTTAGGSLVSSVDASADKDYRKQYDLFLSTEGLTGNAVEAINYLKLLLKSEREAVLHQNFYSANRCARFIKTILQKKGEDIVVRIEDKLSCVFHKNIVTEPGKRLRAELLQLYQDYNLGKDVVLDGDLQVDAGSIVKLASESKLRNALQGTKYADYHFQDSLNLGEIPLEEQDYFRERQLSLAKLEERALYNYTNCKSELDKLMREFMRSRVKRIEEECTSAGKSLSEVEEDDALTQCNARIEKLREKREREPGWVNKTKDTLKHMMNKAMAWFHLEQKEQPGENRERRSGWGKYNKLMEVGKNGYRVRLYQDVTNKENKDRLLQEQLREASLESLWWSKVQDTGVETAKFLKDRLKLVEAIHDNKLRSIPESFKGDVEDYFKDVHKDQWKQYKENPQQLFEKVGIEGGIINWEGFSELVLETLEAFYPEKEDLIKITPGMYLKLPFVKEVQIKKGEVLSNIKNLEDFDEVSTPKDDAGKKKNMAQRVLFVLNYCINPRLEQSEKSKDNIRQVLGGGKTVAICFAHAMDAFCSGENAERSYTDVKQIMKNVWTYIELRKNNKDVQEISEKLRANPAEDISQLCINARSGENIGEVSVISGLNGSERTQKKLDEVDDSEGSSQSSLKELKRGIATLINEHKDMVSKNEVGFLTVHDSGAVAAADPNAELLAAKNRVTEKLGKCIDRICGFIAENQSKGCDQMRWLLTQLRSFNLSVSAPVVEKCLLAVVERLNPDGTVQSGKENEILAVFRNAYLSAKLEESLNGIRQMNDQDKTMFKEEYISLVNSAKSVESYDDLQKLLADKDENLRKAIKIHYINNAIFKDCFVDLTK